MSQSLPTPFQVCFEIPRWWGATLHKGLSLKRQNGCSCRIDPANPLTEEAPTMSEGKVFDYVQELDSGQEVTLLKCG